MMRRSAPTWLCLAAFLVHALPAQGHSVAQVQTAKRISAATVAILDPEGNPLPGGNGTNTRAQVGDILTFIIRFTPVPNNATRGAGGYITEYVPANTEVVGARFVDAAGNTVFPHRGPQMDDGWGPRGRHNGFDNMGLEQGSLSQVYADTGIFFSVDPRTARAPADNYITVVNGIVVTPVPTGAGQLDNFLGFAGPPFYAHNAWDFAQAIAYGANGGSVVSNGQGNTPFGYGSAVAGPQTHYAFEKVATPACSDGMDNDGDGLNDYPNDPQCSSTLDNDETANANGPVGPWQRIRYQGSETGAGLPTNCASCTGGYVRTGVPTSLGWELNLDNPLPAATNAVRFAVGELVVGEEYLAEISLRVTGLPLDPVMNRDVNCSEVFGGDAAMPQNGQDNTWRYFVPAPACVSLDLQFDLDVDKLLAVSGDTLVYTIKGKNLSVNPLTNVVVTDTFVNGDVSFLATLQGPAPVVANGLLTWPTMNLAPGGEFLFQWSMTVTGNGLSTLNRARIVSDQQGAPGFSVVALTDIEALSVLKQAGVASTAPATAPPQTTAGSNVHYTTTVTNLGTGPATLNGASFVKVALPAGFSFCPAPTCAAPRINGINVANPAVAGSVLTFTAGLAAVPANGGVLTLDLDVTVGAGVTPGLYSIIQQAQFRDNGVGRDVEVQNQGLAPLLVDISRSAAPVVFEPLYSGQTVVSGTTSEGPGTLVTVIINGQVMPAVTAGAGGAFTVNVPTLFGGQHVHATALAAGKVESFPSSPDVVVLMVPPTLCSDGLDNDGDTLVDFPQDPGCLSAVDDSEEGGCATSAHCGPPIPVCNTATNLCVACLTGADCASPTPACDTSTFTCVGCLTSANCVAPTPVCDTQLQSCVGCLSSADCGGTTPACHLLSRTCVGCQDQADCAAAGGPPVCNTTTLTCVQCLGNADCSGNTPACNTTTNTCVECLNNTHCDDTPNTPVCHTQSQTCVGCLSDFYCLPPTPVCDLNAFTCVATGGGSSSSGGTPASSSGGAASGSSGAVASSSGVGGGSSVAASGGSSPGSGASSAASSGVGVTSNGASSASGGPGSSGGATSVAVASSAMGATSVAAGSSGGGASSGLGSSGLASSSRGVSAGSSNGGVSGVMGSSGAVGASTSAGGGEDPAPSGCACNTSDGAPAAVWVLLGGMVAWLRRRRNVGAAR